MHVSELDDADRLALHKIFISELLVELVHIVIFLEVVRLVSQDALNIAVDVEGKERRQGLAHAQKWAGLVRRQHGVVHLFVKYGDDVAHEALA